MRECDSGVGWGGNGRVAFDSMGLGLEGVSCAAAEPPPAITDAYFEATPYAQGQVPFFLCFLKLSVAESKMHKSQGHSLVNFCT